MSGGWGSINRGRSSVDVVVSGTTVRTRINNPCGRTLELTLLVRSGVFWCVCRPFPRGGYFGLPSTWFDHSSSYRI